MTFEELLSHILDISPTELTDTHGPKTLSTWSSLVHINIITALEEQYDVFFSTNEIQAIASVSDLRHLLTQKGATL